MPPRYRIERNDPNLNTHTRITLGFSFHGRNSLLHRIVERLDLRSCHRPRCIAEPKELQGTLRQFPTWTITHVTAFLLGYTHLQNADFIYRDRFNLPSVDQVLSDAHNDAFLYVYKAGIL